MSILKTLTQNTPVMQRDNPRQRMVYWLMCVVVAAAMALAASGSGNPSTVEPLPDWINTGSNIICVIIGIAVLIPRLRSWGALASAIMMLASIATNYMVDGPEYALKVLPFNLLTMAVSISVLWHHRSEFALVDDF